MQIFFLISINGMTHPFDNCEMDMELKKNKSNRPNINLHP